MFEMFEITYVRGLEYLSWWWVIQGLHMLITTRPYLFWFESNGVLS